MVDIYRDWDTFISKMDVVPEQLDGEKLIGMVAGLSRSHEERELLIKEAAGEDELSLKSLINSFIPMVVENLKKYVPHVGYNREILINCVDKVRSKIVSTTNYDNLEADMRVYLSYMVKSEVILYLASHGKNAEQTPIEEPGEDYAEDTLFKELEKLRINIPSEKNPELSEELFAACANEGVRQLIGFRLGLEDGVHKTLQETADRFEISIERVIQIERTVIRKIRLHISNRIFLRDVHS